MATLRLDKFLADAGIGSRTKVKELAKQGRIAVNGAVVKKTELKVDTCNDEITFDGRQLTYSEFQYFMLNKPAGVVSATTDNINKTVIELITEEKRRDLFPVGRLDKDTEGLLIITNDGKTANNLLAPGKHVDKKYFARIEGEVSEDTVKQFLEGLDIGDDTVTKPAKLTILSSGEISEIEVVITEGRYHQIKRMFEAVDMKVLYLKRLSMGELFLDDNLACGEYRKLTESEVAMIKGLA